MHSHALEIMCHDPYLQAAVYNVALHAVELFPEVRL